MAILLGIIMLIVGIYALINPEQVRMNADREFERTHQHARTFEGYGVFVGILGTIVGVIMLFVGITQEVDNNNNATATTVANEAYTTLRQTFDPIIPTLRAQSEPDIVHALTNDERGSLGLDESTRVFYGQCMNPFGSTSDPFFMVVMNWNGTDQDYALASYFCAPGQVIGFSGQGWVEVRLPDNYYDYVLNDLATMSAENVDSITPEAPDG